MDRRHGGIDQRLQRGLRLSSDEAFAREKAREAERAAYRRDYWQGYASRVKRVFGTLSPSEYREVKARADAHDRSVWGQIHAEAEAYRRREFLPTPQIERNQRQLLGEMQQINQHLGLLARLGHIQADGAGALGARPGDGVGTQTLKQVGLLEAAMRRFMNAPVPQDEASE